MISRTWRLLFAIGAALLSPAAAVKAGNTSTNTSNNQSTNTSSDPWSSNSSSSSSSNSSGFRGTILDERRDERIDARRGGGFIGYRHELYKSRGGLRSPRRERYGKPGYRSRRDD